VASVRLLAFGRSARPDARYRRRSPISQRGRAGRLTDVATLTLTFSRGRSSLLRMVTSPIDRNNNRSKLQPGDTPRNRAAATPVFSWGGPLEPSSFPPIEGPKDDLGLPRILLFICSTSSGFGGRWVPEIAENIAAAWTKFPEFFLLIRKRLPFRALESIGNENSDLVVWVSVIPVL